MISSPSETERFAPVLDFVDSYSRFAVFTHLTPDGDALGSSFALTCMLREMGKAAVTVLLEPMPEKYVFDGFAPLHVNIEQFDPQSVDASICVDCAAKKRLGTGMDAFFAHPNLCIDHHLSNEGFADVSLVEESPATAQIIHDLFVAADVPMSRTAETAMYIGILTDTGNLTYASTTPRSFAICAEFAASGLDTSTIAEQIFHMRSYGATCLIGVFIRNLEMFSDGRIALSHIGGHQIQKSGASVADTESLVNYARDIDTVEVAVFLRELARHKYKVSLRSRRSVNVSELAAQYGGGGHARAAGCVIEGRLEDVQDTIVRAVQELLP